MGMYPPKNLLRGDGCITIPSIWMVNWTADKPTACVLLRKQRGMYAFYIFSPYNISFTSISTRSISLGFRPLDPVLGIRLWTPLGDFRPPRYLPLCVNPSPQSYRAVDATIPSEDDITQTDVLNPKRRNGGGT